MHIFGLNVQMHLPSSPLFRILLINSIGEYLPFQLTLKTYDSDNNRFDQLPIAMLTIGNLLRN